MDVLIVIISIAVLMEGLLAVVIVIKLLLVLIVLGPISNGRNWIFSCDIKKRNELVTLQWKKRPKLVKVVTFAAGVDYWLISSLRLFRSSKNT